MSIRPVDFNGMIQRTDDVGQIKAHEDQKPYTDQQIIQGQIVRREGQLAHQVINPQENSAMENHADAREEGKNKYVAKRRKNSEKNNGRVIKKQSAGGFDFKI